MRFTFFFSAWVALTLMVLGSCKESPKTLNKKELIKEMATVDKALIPALYLTSINKQFSSLEAMSKLTPKLDHFIQKYKGKNPEDARWDRDLDNIKAKLKYANEHVKANQLALAKQKDLDPILSTFVQMRNRNGIHDYVPDILYKLHSTSTSLAHSIAFGENTPKEAQEAMVQSTGKMYDSLKDNFKKLKSTKVDNTLYTVPPKKRKYLMSVYDELSKAIDQTDQALASKDIRQISNAYKELPKHFIEAYLVFGDFEALQKKM